MESSIWLTLYGAFEVAGLLSAYNALMTVRTSQGAVAWIVSLLTLPVVSVPAYWVFGRRRFRGYQALRDLKTPELHHVREEILRKAGPFRVEGASPGADRLAKMSFLTGNSLQLLIDGKATFDSLLEGIDRAESYVLVQFFIIRDDGLGGRLKEKLKAAARRGVRVYLLYDEMGSSGLRAYGRELREAGVEVSPFHANRGSGNRFQLNFRNHRKIVVVDGEEGWVGGHNVGDEYLGKSAKFSGWRDTHVKISGPAVLQLQLTFLEDWHWAQDRVLDLPWKPVGFPGGCPVLILPTGPADELETCSLMFQQAIHSARRRFWVASPYFVPDSPTLSALLLAAIRGVDVRVLTPDVPDHWMVYFSAYSFLRDLIRQGARIYRYQAGFLHEKVFLVDDQVAGVGTANLDNRSFRLNFEVTALIQDGSFLSQVQTMFEGDFARARPMTEEEIARKPLWFRVLSRACYLAAPIQ